MNTLNIVCLMTLLICSGISLTTAKNHTKTCRKLLKYLAHTQQDYIYCSTTHAVPVKLCTGCEPNFTDMVVAYETVQQNCSHDYFNHDRINVVETTHKMLHDLWNKAYCDDCFSSNNSETFDQKAALLSSCLEQNKNGSECANCVSEYQDLNSFYVQIDEHNNGKVCFDLQDAMNITRVLWSNTLNCCRRELRMTWFVVAVSSFGILPVLFYVGAIILTKRRERNHAVLHNNEATGNSQQIQAATPTSSTAAPTINEDDFDDEILSQMKKIT